MQDPLRPLILGQKVAIILADGILLPTAGDSSNPMIGQRLSYLGDQEAATSRLALLQGLDPPVHTRLNERWLDPQWWTIHFSLVAALLHN